LSGTPTPVGDGLWGQEVQAQEEMERHWEHVSSWLSELLADRGVDAISAEELTVPPGMDELFSLLQIKQHYDSDEFDAVVVDCAPTGETLRLLSFPDVCTWWLEKVFPWERRLMAAARPIARGLLDIPVPGDGVFEEVERLARNLVAMNEILRDRTSTSIRLVMNPDRMVIKEAQRTFTYLNLYGYLTDAVIVNRIFPADVEGSYFDAWLGHQRRNLEQVREGFAPVPILTSRYFAEEVIGPGMLDVLGSELFADHAPEAVLHSELAQELSMEGDVATLRLPIPFTEKAEIDLKKVGDELIVSVGGEKRTIILPSALAEHRPSGASFEAGTLEVTFDDVRSPRPQPERV
jgi:arsenite/tail-anchored protein-transporting ATPase